STTNSSSVSLKRPRRTAQYPKRSRLSTLRLAPSWRDTARRRLAVQPLITCAVPRFVSVGGSLRVQRKADGFHRQNNPRTNNWWTRNGLWDRAVMVGLKDRRLQERLGELSRRLGEAPSWSFPQVFQDPASLEACYRFFNNVK